MQKAEGVIRTPEKFFNSAKSEKSIKPAFIFNAVLTAFYVIVSYLIGIGTGDVPYSITGIVFGWVSSILLAFPMVGFFHLFVMLLGGKNGFVSTYKACIYASTVSLFMLIAMPFVGLGIAGMAIGGLITLAVLIWTIYVTVKGVSVLQKMSMWKSFAALVIAAVVALIIIAIVAILFFMPVILAAIAAAA